MRMTSGGDSPQSSWVGACARFPKPLPYLRPKLRFSFPIYELNENLILYLRPDP